MLRHMSLYAFAGSALLLCSADLRAQCCRVGALGSRGGQAQALQAQLLQAQLLQAQLSQVSLVHNLSVLQANQHALAAAAASKSGDRQLTAQPALPTSKSDEAAAAALAKELTQGTPAKRKSALAAFKTREGDVYTRALANALPKLYGETRTQARAVLAERLTNPQQTP